LENNADPPGDSCKGKLGFCLVIVLLGFRYYVLSGDGNMTNDKRRKKNHGYTGDQAGSGQASISQYFVTMDVQT